MKRALLSVHTTKRISILQHKDEFLAKKHKINY